jgi:hypothetical protein
VNLALLVLDHGDDTGCRVWDSAAATTLQARAGHDLWRHARRILLDETGRDTVSAHQLVPLALMFLATEPVAG